MSKTDKVKTEEKTIIKDEPPAAAVGGPAKDELEDPTINVACVYDGSLESAIMIHRVVKDGKKVTVFQNPQAKFGKLNLPEENISGIGEHKDESKILAYVKECGKACIKKGIKFLYIGWSTDKMNTNIGRDNKNPDKHPGRLLFQDLFISGVPKALSELTPEDKPNDFVRAVFYNYGRSTEDIEKHKRQYGYE